MHLIERAGLAEQVERRMADVKAEVKLEKSGNWRGKAVDEVKHSSSSDNKKAFRGYWQMNRCAEQQDVCEIKHKAFNLFVAVRGKKLAKPGTKFIA